MSEGTSDDMRRVVLRSVEGEVQHKQVSGGLSSLHPIKEVVNTAVFALPEVAFSKALGFMTASSGSQKVAAQNKEALGDQPKGFNCTGKLPGKLANVPLDLSGIGEGTLAASGMQAYEGTPSLDDIEAAYVGSQEGVDCNPSEHQDKHFSIQNDAAADQIHFKSPATSTFIVKDSPNQDDTELHNPQEEREISGGKDDSNVPEDLKAGSAEASDLVTYLTKDQGIASGREEEEHELIDQIHAISEEALTKTAVSRRSLLATQVCCLSGIVLC